MKLGCAGSQIQGRSNEINRNRAILVVLKELASNVPGDSCAAHVGTLPCVVSYLFESEAMNCSLWFARNSVPLGSSGAVENSKPVTTFRLSLELINNWRRVKGMLVAVSFTNPKQGKCILLKIWKVAHYNNCCPS